MLLKLGPSKTTFVKISKQSQAWPKHYEPCQAAWAKGVKHILDKDMKNMEIGLWKFFHNMNVVAHKVSDLKKQK